MSERTTLSIVRSGNNVIISWTGGIEPFQLFKTNALVGNSADLSVWTPVGNPTLARSATVPIIDAQAFFRVQSEVPLMTATQDNSNVHLAWGVPELAQ